MSIIRDFRNLHEYKIFTRVETDFFKFNLCSISGVSFKEITLSKDGSKKGNRNLRHRVPLRFFPGQHRLGNVHIPPARCQCGPIHSANAYRRVWQLFHRKIPQVHFCRFPKNYTIGLFILDSRTQTKPYPLLRPDDLLYMFIVLFVYWNTHSRIHKRI